MIDHNDNLYFWTGNGRLHSIDKKGRFRWIFELCDKERRNRPHVMDFFGDLFFFLDDELFVLDSFGQLKIQRKLILPGIRPDPIKKGRWGNCEKLTFGGGEIQDKLSLRLAGTEPVLTTDGHIWATFALTSDVMRQGRSGIVKIDRVGRIKKVLIPFNEINSGVILGRMVGADDGSILLTATVDENPDADNCDLQYLSSQERAAGLNNYLIKIVDDEIALITPIKGEVRQVSLAAAQDGLAWGISDDDELLHLGGDSVLNIKRSEPERHQAFNPFTRPVIGNNQTLYVNQDAKTAKLIAVDLKKNKVQWSWSSGSYAGMVASSALITSGGNIYTTAGSNIVAFDKNGKNLWRYDSPSGIYPSTMAVLSDSTLLVGARDGNIYFLKEKDIHNKGLAQSQWPRAYHDNYHSNNAAHPFRWDQNITAPYESVTRLKKDLANDWNCNQDSRCFTRQYFDTCEWSGTQVSSDHPNAVCYRDNIHKKKCLVKITEEGLLTSIIQMVLSIIPWWSL